MDPSTPEIVDILERELEKAFEVKDKKSLHRYVVLMVERFAERRQSEDGFRQLTGEIHALADTMRQGFERMDARFEAIDARFEAVDTRFEAVDKRFEAMDKRFEDMQAYMDKRFEDMQANMDKRFESMQSSMDKRFNMLVVLSSVFFTILAGMMTAIRLFG